MKNIDLALMTGIDIPIEECNIVLHQPTIEEIAFLGEQEYFLAIQTICLDKRSMIDEEQKELLLEITNLQIFLAVMSDKSFSEKKYAVKNAFSILFPNYTVIITQNSLSFFMKNSDDQTGIIIEDQNFNILQDVIKEVCCLKTNSMQAAGFNPQDARAKEIADKLMRGRQRVAAQKQTNDNFSLLGQYISIIAIGVYSTSLNNAMKLTMYQVFDLVERYSKYIAWDIDLRVRLAGGKSDKEPENWMKNIH